MSSAKLEELSRFALALNSPSSPRTPSGGKGRRKQHQELARRLRVATSAGTSLSRDAASELSAIRSVDELEIDYSQALSIKRGDLAIIQGEVFRAFPKAYHLRDIPLILKRLDCVDRRTYDLKVYEADTFARFQGHSNILSLYSFWSEKPSNQYTFKTLVLLLEEGVLGDMLNSVVKSEKRPSNRLALKWCCDIAKGLIAIHNCNIIHGRIKPGAIYLDADRNAMIGEFGKVELDSARQTHQLFSKVLIGEAIPHTLVYWAPELLKLEKYGKAIDMWAFGVTLYQIVTGHHPFDMSDENTFRDDALTANIDISRLEDYPRILTIVKNLIVVDPEDRWTANQVLAFAQQDFAVEIQRLWRGHGARKFFRWAVESVIKIQSNIRRFLSVTNYRNTRDYRRKTGANRIQAAFRSYIARTEYNRIRDVWLRCQANVLARQCRRSYLKYKYSCITGQSFIRRFLVMRWFDRVKAGRSALESKLRTIQTMIVKYREEANEFCNLFNDGSLPKFMAYLGSFEDYELSLPEELLQGVVALPRLRSAESRIQGLESETAVLKEKVKAFDELKKKEEEEEKRMREELGIKYAEYTPMVEALKKNLKRVAEQCASAEYLDVKIQHEYVYSKWDAVHEPYNVVENVLTEDESVYRTVSPDIDLTLYDGSVCFISEITIYPGEPGPANVELFGSQVPEKWTYIQTFKCNRDAVQTFHVSGEQMCKYIRLRMKNNIRGGNIVSIRHVKVKGLVKG